MKQLIQEYADYYCDTIEIVSNEIVEIARLSPNTYLSCLYSRVDKNKCDYSIRKGMFTH